jgi:phenylacetate-CoA ligase
MLRSLLLKASARAKTDGIIDRFVRYNPILRKRVLPVIHPRTEGLLRELLASEPATLTQRTLRAAQSTIYGNGRNNVLKDWPLLEKTSLRASSEDFIAPGAWLRLPAATGGTTGIPLKLWRSLESVVAEQIFLDDLLKLFGHDMRHSRIAVLRGDRVESTPEHSYGRLSHGGNRLTLSTPHLNHETLPAFYDSLQRFAPSILWVYPNTALNLLKLLQNATLKLEIPVILSSSETMSASLHRTLERSFNAKVINYYGQAERVCFAYSIEPDKFYFNPRYGHVEFHDADSSGASGRCLEIVGTGHWNMVMPLVRYRTGDLARVPFDYGAKELEEVANGKRSFPEILGRDQEYVLTLEGLRITGLNQIPKEVQNVFQIQLVQPDYHTVIIRVVAMPDYSEEDAKKILAQARLKIPMSIAVRIELADNLLVTKRGKAPYILRTFDSADV